MGQPSVSLRVDEKAEVIAPFARTKMADGSDRKRKRAEDSAPRSKKQKTSTPFTTTVSEVLKSKKSPLVVGKSERPDKQEASVLTDHIIATVSGLKLSNELRFRPQEQPRVQAPLDRSLGRRSSGRTLVLKSSSHPTTDYTALEEHSDGKVVLKHYVGVYDPETGTLQVVEAKKMAIQATVRPREFEGEAPAEPTKTKASYTWPFGGAQYLHVLGLYGAEEPAWRVFWHQEGEEGA